MAELSHKDLKVGKKYKRNKRTKIYDISFFIYVVIYKREFHRDQTFIMLLIIET